MTEQARTITQNLKDAGCEAGLIERFLHLHEEGETAEGFRLLSKQRKSLLDTIHAEQKKLDNLDYLIFILKKEKTYGKTNVSQ